MTFDWILPVIAALPGLLACWLYGRSRHGRQDTSNQLVADPAQYQALANEFKTLATSNIGMAKRLEQLHQTIKQMGLRLDGLEHQAPEPALYAQAIRMAERGTGVTELMDNFGLSRTEAELLQKLHQQRRDNTGHGSSQDMAH